MGYTEQILTELDHGKPLILNDAERARMKEDFESAFLEIGLARLFGLHDGRMDATIQHVITGLNALAESNSKS